MAAITGTWKDQRAVQAGAGIWGTGWNPIHAERNGEGRNLAPDPSGHLVDPVLTGQYENEPEGGFTTEDFHLIEMYGYGTETGTADRPSLGQSDVRAETHGFPPPPQTGEIIRSEDHGADATNTQKVTPQHDAAQGWINKAHGEEGYAKPSDPSQYEVATSMRQRMETRTGSQVQAGRASQYLQPIASRLVGQKVKFFSGGVRHAEMFPRQQTISVRGFWNRGAGTGPPHWMIPNEFSQTDPMQRTPPSDPYQGTTVGDLQATDTADEGWYY